MFWASTFTIYSVRLFPDLIYSCSDDESGNALVAMDEDLSSPEEEPLVPVVTKQPEPLKPKPPSRPPVTLKSPKDVVLTESEGEESPEEESRKKEVSSTKKKQQQELLDIFVKEPSETPKKESGGLKISADTGTKKSGGLMMEFKQEQPKKAKEPKDSPDFREEKRERKKKKSKKSKSRETTTEKAPAVRSEDLFGLTSSLDAWLNAEPESNTAGLVSEYRHTDLVPRPLQAFIASHFSYCKQ